MFETHNYLFAVTLFFSGNDALVFSTKPIQSYNRQSESTSPVNRTFKQNLKKANTKHAKDHSAPETGTKIRCSDRQKPCSNETE